ncbi:MAG: 1-deoxy-D-xylulose-5-phosphate reductoisomerase [Ectothiorhodospiraceae bacterium]|jgi:1-deoxy-D-xylulose-5-phosphate reductoisomerase
MQQVTILGSTGSIGTNTLDVVARHPGRFRVFALTANRDVEGLYRQTLRHRPRHVAMADGESANRLRQLLADGDETPRVIVHDGLQAIAELAGEPESDCVVAGIVGSAGLAPTLAAARAGKRILLANKEALVVAGALLMDEVAASGATLIPVDSEHNAVFQCLPPTYREHGLDAVGVRRILLTASGGPFRTRPVAELQGVTPDEACAHPNWDMGRKISVDSATMINKGLELIEACWLFATEPRRIQVVIHPQSIVHSLVEYADGSVLAQLGNPDMRTPIAHALGMPDRIEAGVEPLDLFRVARLDFEEPDAERFPCLGLARRAMETGGTAPAILNAANEVAVDAFLSGGLGFTAIAPVIEETLSALRADDAESIEQLMAVDRQARSRASEIAHRLVQR